MPIVQNLTGIDHIYGAFNDRGDLALVLERNSTVGGAAANYCLGVVLRATNGVLEGNAGRTTYVLGDPTLGVTGGTDSCDKGRVAANGRDFLFAWPRVNKVDSTGTIEFALLDMTTAADGVLRTRSTGRGYEAFAVDFSTSANNIGLCAASVVGGAGRFFVCAPNLIAEAGNHRDYDVLAALIRFPSTLTYPLPTVYAEQTLATAKVDGAQGSGYGRIAPILTERGDGKIFLSYEEYEFATRGTVTTDTGRVFVKACTPTANGALAVYSTASLAQTTVKMRRPAVQGNLRDTANISLAWTEDDVEILFRNVTETGGNIAISAEVASITGTVTTAAPLHTETTRAVVGVLADGSDYVMRMKNESTDQTIASTISDVRRAATAAYSPASGAQVAMVLYDTGSVAYYDPVEVG